MNVNLDNISSLSQLYDVVLQQAGNADGTGKLDEAKEIKLDPSLLKEFTTIENKQSSSLDSPNLPTPEQTSSKDLKAWTNLTSPWALVASLIIDQAQQQRQTNLTMIKTEGEMIVANIEQQADKIKEGAIQKFACALTGAALNIAGGLTSLGSHAIGMKQGAAGNPQMVEATAQSLNGIFGSAGSMFTAGGEFGESLRSAESKELEADAERIRTTLELTKQSDEALRDLVSKSLDYINSMQSNMNQTRAKILG